MKINKKLYIQLLEDELLYERQEHKVALIDMEIEGKSRRNVEQVLDKVILERDEFQQKNKEIEGLKKMLEDERLANHELHDGLKDAQEIIGDLNFRNKRLIDMTVDLKKEIYDLGKKIFEQGPEVVA